MQIPLGQLVQSMAVIAASAQQSSLISTSGAPLVGVYIPAGFTGTHISFLTAFQGSGPFSQLDNKLGQVVYPVTAGHYVAIDPIDFHGVEFLKIVSDAMEAAQRTLIPVLKGF